MILCDMDGVLAVGPHRDTEWNQPIFRTFSQVPEEFGRIRRAGIPLHLVTAKVEAEAAQVLRAIGLHDHFDSIVGGDRLFWPTLWAAARNGRFPGALAKSACRNILPPTGEGQRVVMIEDQPHNLLEMLAVGAIDFGILVPPFTRSGDRVEDWFDLNLALRFARELTTGEVDPTGLADSGSIKLQDMKTQVNGVGSLLHLPAIETLVGPPSPLIDSIDTGQDLIPKRRNAVSIARIGSRLVRRMMVLLPARVEQGGKR